MRKLKSLNLVLLLIVFFGAFVLRYYNITYQSLWLDELYTMNMSDPANSFSEIYDLSHSTDPLSYIYFFLVNVCFKVFGFTDLVARLVSLCFGLVGILGIFVLARELNGIWCAHASAAMLAVNEFHIYYSQEARVYTMYMAFTCFSFYYLIRFIKSGSGKNAVYYGISAALMLLSHFFGLFTLVAQFGLLGINLLFLERSHRVKFAVRIIFSVVIISICFIPSLSILKIISNNNVSWIEPLDGNSFSRLFNAFFADSFFLQAFIILFLLVYLINFFLNSSEDSERVGRFAAFNFTFLTVWILVTFLIPYFNSFVKVPMITSRYMINILPGVIIISALGLSLIKSRGLRNAILVLFLALNLGNTILVNNYYEKTSKSEFKGSARFVVDHNVMKASIVTTLPYHYKYYMSLFGNEAMIENMSFDDKITSLRLGKQLKPFWGLEGHSRPFEITDTNRIFLNDNFEQVYFFNGKDAWARFFLPKKIHNEKLKYKLTPSDFSPQGSAEAPVYFFKNDSMVSKKLNLPQGKHNIVVFSQSFPAKPIQGINAQYAVYANNVFVTKVECSATSLISGDSILLEVRKDTGIVLKLKFLNDTSFLDLDRNLIFKGLEIL